ncbi:hypothetical protein HN588_06670 [Candidatus Bathyarchaeota archaeon]|jgi:hypothetical protein|nr:hypothetical protein [Candidatus Bathyarchaeota archaeon]
MDKIVYDIVTQQINRQFEWGEFDCTTPVVVLLEKITGSCLGEYKNLWHDQQSAMDYMRAHSYLDALLKFPHTDIEWGRERTGDIFYIEYDLKHDKSHQTTGIVYGNRLLMVTEADGMILLPLRTVGEPKNILRIDQCQ